MTSPAGGLMRCGWPVRTAETTTVWWCRAPFAHEHPHELTDDQGRVVESSAGFYDVAPSAPPTPPPPP